MTKKKTRQSLRQELLAATKIKKKSTEKDSAFRVRLAQAVSKLDPEAWTKLSGAAQDWYNDSVDLIKKGKGAAPLPLVKASVQKREPAHEEPDEDDVDDDAEDEDDDSDDDVDDEDSDDEDDDTEDEDADDDVDDEDSDDEDDDTEDEDADDEDDIDEDEDQDEDADDEDTDDEDEDEVDDEDEDPDEDDEDEEEEPMPKRPPTKKKADQPKPSVEKRAGTVQQISEYIAQNPKHSKARVTQALKKQGVEFTPDTLVSVYGSLHRTMTLLESQGWTPPEPPKKTPAKKAAAKKKTPAKKTAAKKTAAKKRARQR